MSSHAVRIYAPIEGVAFSENGHDVINRSELESIIQLEYGQMTSQSVQLTTTDANQTLDSVPIESARTLRYLIQASANGEYHSTEAIIVHNGTVAHMTEFADEVWTGEAGLITLSADLTTTDLVLKVTPAFTNTSFKLIRTIVSP